MKKNIFLVLMIVSLISMIFPKDISPVLSIRYDNLDAGIAVSDAIGLQLDLGGDKFTGFDTNGTDYRIYVGWGFGKIGLGHDGAAPTSSPQYTVGATYPVLDNLNLDLDYVMGAADVLRLSMNIQF